MIITQEHLFTHNMKNILAEMYITWVADGQNESFDQYCFNHLSDLGEALYNYIGEAYIDFDELAEEIF